MEKALLLIFAASLLIACSNNDVANDEATSTDTTQTNVATDETTTDSGPIIEPTGVEYYDELAKFISGAPGIATEQFKEFSKDTSWTRFAKQITGSWDRFESQKLAAIKPWTKNQITSKNRFTKTVFYPFSGPDFTYMNAIQPNVETSYLFGLEPVGKIPDASEFDKDSLYQLFNAMRNAVDENLNFSFFITRQMKNEMNNEQISGTIPILMLFLARSGKKILNVEPIKISSEGDLEVIPSDNLVDKGFKKIVEISYTETGSGITKKLYYFQMNINDHGFERNPRMVKFFNKLPKETTTFVKSASYCMHQDNFSKIRNVVVNKSKYLIQDDTGVPFKFFDDKKWVYDFYGTYDRPIATFGLEPQEDYKIHFENAKKLPFRFGYNRSSNIFVATRK